MSPFSKYLHQLRTSYGVRQVELAEWLGCYISALEIGTKGPPAAEFVQRLIKVLSLTEEQQQELHKAIEASQRKLVIPNGVIQLIKDCPPTPEQLKALYGAN